MNACKLVSTAAAAILTVACSSAASGSQAPATTGSVAGAAAPLAPTGAIAGTPAAPPTAAGKPAAAPAAVGGQVSATGLVFAPLEPGFQRLVAPALEVPAGANADWIQWVTAPMDQDYDVVEIKGRQSKGGHHAVLMSTMEAQPMGFTRTFSENDQLSTNSLGGIGSEGNVSIPPGIVFRVGKGRSLAIQVHYLNATDKPIQSESYIDVKMTPRDNTHVVAGHFNVSSLKIAVMPKTQTTADIYCGVGEDIKIIRSTNHMHYAGVSAFTESVDAAGVKSMLKMDERWMDEWALQPNYAFYPIDKPLLIPKGSRIHLQCTWNSTAEKPMTFPEEMCAFATVILGGKEITCVDDKFNVNDPEAPRGSAAAPAAGTPSPAPAAGAPAVVASGACTGAADKAVVEGPDFESTQLSCGRMCFGGAESCAADCLTKSATLTPDCAKCQGARLGCALKSCIGDCTGGFADPTCKMCLAANCDPAYHTCSGL